MDAQLKIFTMFFIASVVEYLVLRRCYPRRSLLFCVFSVALAVGFLGSAFSYAMVEFRASPFHPGPPNEMPPVYSDKYVLYFIFGWILTGVAMLPAGLTAFIYRRFKSQK